MTTNELFADRVFKLRRQLKLSQAEFAKMLHIGRTYLSDIENGREPSAALKDLFFRIEREHLEGRDSITPIESELLSKEEVARVTEPITFYGARSKLQAARIAKGYTVAEFAKLVGYSLSVYQGIEEGASRMGEKMAKKAAALLDLEVEDLTNGSDHPPSNSVPFGSFGAVPEINMGPGMQGQRAKYVPLLSMAQCGVMQAYTDEAYTGEGFVAYSPDDPHAFAVKLAGDSMQPRIEPGDVAVVFPSKTPRNGSIVLARLDDDHGGDVMCKVFQATKDDVTLSSYNPAYPPLTYPRQSFAWIYPVNSVTKVFS